MTVIALFNQAGGAGKTTLAMNLGYQIAVHGKSVLLIDMDPQSSLTVFMGLDPILLKATMYECLVKDLDVHQIIHSDLNGMSLAPSSLSLAVAETELINMDMRDLRMKDVVDPIAKEYDYILIDCPPSLGMLSYISLVASDLVLVPIQTQFKSFIATNGFLQVIDRVQRRPNRSLKIAGFVPMMFDSRNSHDSRFLEALHNQLERVAPVFPAIPRTTLFADASESRLPLALYQKHSAVSVFDKIVDLLGVDHASNQGKKRKAIATREG